ncbi:hypothetical protein GEMRC1_013687 [Eukaryota sp. GEM-RC1]
MNPRIIDNHLLLLIGDVAWTHSDTSLVSGFVNITTDSTLTILNEEDVELDGDFDSHLYVHGHLIKDNSHSFTHNCPTFVDGSYIIEEGDVYTQKPVIVSNGLTSIINGHLFIEDFVFIDCTSILNGTVEAQISLLKSTSLLNVTGFYEVYGEILLDHTQSMAYFNSNCKIEFINTRVVQGLLHVSGNCVVGDVIGVISGRMIVDSQSIIHLISSLDLNDGHVIVDDSASIQEVANVTLNLDSLIEVKGSSELISTKINLQMINRAQFIVSNNSRFSIINGEFLLRDDVIFQISSSVHGDVELLDLYLKDDATFNVSCVIPIQIRNFYHFGGHRSGDSDVYINIFYHWSGGKLSSHLSTSTTIVTAAATGLLDSTGTMNARIIDNHLLLLIGDVTWTHSDTSLVSGFVNITTDSTLTILNEEDVELDGDFDSHLYVHGHLIKDNSHSFTHNCPTFVDGSYIIEEGNVYTQKPVIVSNGLTSIINGHLFIEDFVFIDCTSILNGTVEAQISLLKPTSLLNVTGFYEVYGEILLDHTQSMAYFNSNCKIEFINTRVVQGLLHVSGNCVVGDVIGVISDRMIVDSQSIIHLISSLDLNDGHVIVDDSASIQEVANVTLNLDSLIEVKGSSELISSKINLEMIDNAQFIVSNNSRLIINNGQFLLRDDVVFQISSSVHGDVELLDLYLKDDATFDVSCVIPIQIRNFYHFGGHRSGDSDVYINIFYHWSGGKLSSHLSTSTTIVTAAATGLLDSTGTMNPRIIDNHLLLLIGDVTWTHSDTSLVSGFVNITTDSTLTILNEEDVELDGDFDSHLYVHGHLIKDNSHSFTHNCPTFVDGSYIIEEGNVYTQKPVIVSNGLTSIINGHLFIEDFVFIDCTSILNGTVEAQISLLKSTSLLNVTGFYEVYGEILLDHTQSMAYFNSNCKIEFINTRVVHGLLHVSGNCVVGDVIGVISDRMIVDSQSIIHLISSLDLNDGHVIVDDSASIREVANVTLNLDSLIEVKGSSELISTKINLEMIDNAQFIVSNNSRFIINNAEFLLRDDVVFQISSSVHGDVELLDLYLKDDATFNVSCVIPIQIRNFYHFGGHRSGDSDVYINIFYHWSGGKLSSHLSTSTTIVTSAATALLDSTETMNPRIIDNHLLLLIGDVTWTHSDTSLVSGFVNITTDSTLTILNEEDVELDGDFDSHLYVHGHLFKDNSHSFTHNCPTFVDGSYIIEEGNVYTQKPVIVSNGLTSIINGHLFIEDFVFIDCTSILNGTVEAQISLLKPTSLLNVTGFYEVYGEILLDHTQSMAYFNSNCKIEFINTRVVQGLLHVSGNCVVGDVIGVISDRMIVDSQSIIHLISSLDLNDGHVIVDGSASIQEVVDVTLNLDSLFEVKGSSELISSKIDLQMIDKAQFIVSNNSRFIINNGEFLLRDDVVFQISSSVHGDVELLDLYLKDDATFNVSCVIPIQIRNFYHFGGHRSGDSDVYINIFYHWSGGKLSSHLSTSTTILTSAAAGLLDSTETMNPRIIDNHLLLLIGDVTWTHSDTSLVSGFVNITTDSTLTILNEADVELDGDFDSHLYVHGHLIKDNSHSFTHNCPTFVDGSYIIEEGNVYTQKPVIVSNGLTSIINGHLFIEDFVFIDCTNFSLKSTSLLNVTGFYEVYGEILLDHTQSMAYFNSNCKIEFINTRVVQGLLHVSGNCVVGDVIGVISDRMIVDSQSIIHLISSLDLNDGHVIVDDSASIREVANVTLNLDSLIEVKGSSELISSKINLEMIDNAQFIVSHNSRFIITNGEFFLPDDVIFQISSSVNGDVELLNLYLRNDAIFNVSCVIPIQIRYFYHFGGHRSGDSDVYINIFYHWSGGKLSSHLSTSTTIVTSAATASLDSTGTMNPRIIDHHQLNISGDGTWTRSDTTLIGGTLFILQPSTFTTNFVYDISIIGDLTSEFNVYGSLLKKSHHTFFTDTITNIYGLFEIFNGSVITVRKFTVFTGHVKVTAGSLVVPYIFTIKEFGSLTGFSLVHLNGLLSRFTSFGYYNNSGILKVSDANALFTNYSMTTQLDLLLEDGTVTMNGQGYMEVLTATVKDGTMLFDDHFELKQTTALTIHHGLVNSSSSDAISFASTLITVDHGKFYCGHNSGSLFYYTYLQLLGRGTVVLEDGLDNPHFAFVNLSNGDFILNQDHLNYFVEVEHLLLDGGSRSGLKMLNISVMFDWITGPLNDNSITFSNSLALIHFPDPKVLGAHHSLVLGTTTLFAEGQLLCGEFSKINNTPNSLFVINGTGEIIPGSDENLPIFLNQETASIVKYGCSRFDVDFILQNEGILRIVNPGSDCETNNIFSIGTSSWSSGVIILDESTILSLLGTFKVNESSLVTGEGEFSITTSSTFVTIAGVFNHSGDLVIKEDTHGSNVVITNTAVVVKMNLQLFADGTVLFDEYSYVPFVAIQMDYGKVSFANNSVVDHLYSVEIVSGLIEVLPGSHISMTDSLVFVGGDGQVILHSDSFTDITNSSFILVGGSVHVQNNSLSATAMFSDALIDGGSLILDAAPMYISELVLLQGQRSGFGLLEVTDKLEWQGGSFIGNGTTRNMNLMVVEGNSLMIIDEGHVLENFGYISLTQGELEAGKFTKIINRPSGEFVIGGDGKLTPTASDEELPIFINEGLFVKGVTDSKFEFLLALQNYGTTDISNGTLAVGTASYSDGIIKISKNSTFKLTGGFIFKNSSIVTDAPGRIHVSDLQSNVYVAGTFNHTGTLLITDGRVEFSRNLFVETVTVYQSGGDFLVNGEANSMSMTLSGGQTNLKDQFVLHQLDFLSLSNSASLTFEPFSNVSSSLSQWLVTGGGIFIAPSVSIYLDRVFLNQSGGVVTFDTTSIENSVHFSDIILCNGVFDLNKIYSIDVDRFVLCGGLRKGTGNLNVYSLFSWTSGVLTEAGTTTLFAPSTFTETTPKTLNNSHSIVNWHHLSLVDTVLDLENASDLVNQINASIILSNSSIVSSTLMEDHYYVKNFGSIILNDYSQSQLVTSLLNNGTIAVTDNSHLETKSLVDNFGHVNIDTSSTLSIYEEFLFQSTSSASGLGTIRISTTSAKVDIGIHLTNISNLIVDDHAVVTSSVGCQLSSLFLIVSNASFVSSYCALSRINITLESAAFVSFHGSSSLSFFNLVINSGKFIGKGPDASIFVLSSTISLSGSTSVMILEGELTLINTLDSLSLSNQSNLTLNHDLHLEDFAVISFFINDSYFYFDVLNLEVLISHFYSHSGFITSNGLISIIQSSDVKSIEFYGQGTTEFASTTQCVFASGTMFIDSHSIIFDCTGTLDNSVIIVLDTHLLISSEAVLTSSMSHFNGNSIITSSGQLFFESINFLNTEMEVKGVFNVKEDSHVYVNTTIFFDTSSQSTLIGDVSVSTSSFVYVSGSLSCTNTRPCILNQGLVAFQPPSLLENIYLKSILGILTVDSSTTVNVMTLSSEGGNCHINSNMEHFIISDFYDGSAIVSSVIEDLSVLKPEGGFIEFVNSDIQHISTFTLSEASSINFNQSHIDMRQSLLTVENGNLLINQDCDLTFSTPSTTTITQHNGQVISRVPLVISHLNLVDGLFSSDVIVQELFSLEDGTIYQSNITLENIEFCSKTLDISDSIIIVDTSLVASCDSTWKIVNSSIIINTPDQFNTQQPLRVVDPNLDSMIAFTKHLLFHESISASLETTVYFVHGATFDGSYFGQISKLMSDDFIIKETGKVSFDELSIPNNSTLFVNDGAFTSGNLEILGILDVSGAYTHKKSLILTPSSEVRVALHLDYSYDKIFVDDVSYNGGLDIAFDPQLPLIESTEYTFFTHQSHQGNFSVKSGSCTFNFDFKYHSNRMFARVGRDFDPEYSEVFYIAPSPYGYDSHCCGSNIAPCRTLVTTLSKAIKGDTIIFMKGTYRGYTPLLFTDERIGYIVGEGAQFECDFDQNGIEISHHQMNLSISSLSFTNCKTAIKSVSSELLIDDVIVTSTSSNSSVGKVLDSFSSFVTYTSSSFTSLSGALFTLHSTSMVNFDYLVLEKCDGILFESLFSFVNIEKLNISEAHNPTIISRSSAFDLNHVIVHKTISTDFFTLMMGSLSIAKLDVVDSSITTPFDLSHSEISLSGVKLNNVEISGTVIKSQFSDIKLSDFHVATISHSLIDAVSSDVCLDNIWFTGLESTLPTIIAANSKITLSSVSALNIDTNLICSTKSNEILIHDCTFTNSKSSLFKCISSTSITISKSQFEHCSSDSNGGVVSVPIDSSLAVSDSLFDSCSSPKGGALHSFSSDFSISSTTFVNNEAEYGGAIYVSAIQTGVSISQSVFDSNHASQSGGAVYVNSTIKPEISDCNFVQNTENSLASIPIRVVTKSIEGSRIILTIVDAYDNVLIDPSRHVILAPGSNTFGLSGKQQQSNAPGEIAYHVAIIGSPEAHTLFAVSHGLDHVEFTVHGGECQDGEGMDPVTGNCIMCPSGTKAVNNDGFPVCEPCGIGEWSQPGSSSCSSCLPGSKRSFNDTGCVSCTLEVYCS